VNAARRKHDRRLKKRRLADGNGREDPLGGPNLMTGLHSKVRQLSLSIAGILVVILFVGLACVPEELRAGVASRMARSRRGP